MHQNDYGTSYAIRLSDSRYIVIDGGHENATNAEYLYQVLRKGSPHEKPVIAVWIQSYPHIDHYRCFMLFMKLYGDQVTVQRMLFHFPDANDTERYPKLYNIAEKEPSPEDTETYCIGRMLRVTEEYNIPVFTPHTGQIYRIGDSVIHILGCMDDTIHRSRNINMTSLFFRMELGKQVILWTCDGAFSEVELDKKCPDYLKADILQVPHHGFQCGTAEGEIRAYSIIRPSCCLMPVEPQVAFSRLCITYPEILLTDTDKPIPQNAPFAIRFESDTPIVISHPDHQATYRSQYAD